MTASWMYARLGDNPVVIVKIVTGRQTCHHSAAGFWPNIAVVNVHEGASLFLVEEGERNDRYVIRLAERRLTVLEIHITSGVLHHDVLHPLHVGQERDLILPIGTRHDLQLILYLALEPAVSAQDLPGSSTICWSGSVVPASTEPRKAMKYSSSLEKDELHARQIRTVGSSAGYFLSSSPLEGT